jgi:hypothetical protein
MPAPCRGPRIAESRIRSSSKQGGTATSRVQLALRVADLEGSIAFYSKLFGAEPAKRRPGYANFAIAEPPADAGTREGGRLRLLHLKPQVAAV